MDEAVVLFLMFLILFFVPFVNEKYTDSTIKEKKVIDGFNEYETKIIKQFKKHIDEYREEGKVFLPGTEFKINFYVPSPIGSVDLNKVRMYVNMNLKLGYYIEDITVKRNKQNTKVKWYVIKYYK